MQVARRLGDAVRARRADGIRLLRRPAPLEIAVDLVGGDLDEPGPRPADLLEEHLRPEELGAPEVGGAEDRAVDVRLGGQVDDRLAALGRAGDGLGVGDVPDPEVAVDPLEVLPTARVGELVEHDDLVAAPDEALDEVAADEPAAAGDEDPHVLIVDASEAGEALAQALPPVGKPRRAVALAAEDRVRRPRRGTAQLLGSRSARRGSRVRPRRRSPPRTRPRCSPPRPRRARRRAGARAGRASRRRGGRRRSGSRAGRRRPRPRRAPRRAAASCGRSSCRSSRRATSCGRSSRPAPPARPRSFVRP